MFILLWFLIAFVWYRLRLERSATRKAARAKEMHKTQLKKAPFLGAVSSGKGIRKNPSKIFLRKV